MAIDKEDDGVLSRWSKRKRGLDAEETEEEALSIEEQQEINDAHQIELLENRQAAEEIDLETIDEESDLSVFMKDGVPEALKKQALAMLWRSNPVFANIDGLNDYDDDFGSSDLIMKTFKSAYQAGRGYLKAEPEPEEEITVAELEEENEVEEALVEDEIEVSEDDADKNVSEETEFADDPVEMAEADLHVDEEVAMPKVSLRQRLMQEG